MATKKANLGKSTYARSLPLVPTPPPPPPLPPDFGAGGVPGGVPGGTRAGVMGGILSSIPRAPNGAIPQSVRVDQGISQGLLIKQGQPVHPKLAKQARVQ